MEKQEYKSKWDELVREIGVEVPPEIIEREEAVSAKSESPALPSKPIETSPPPPLAPPPKRTAVNWGNLATELGLPPLPPEPEPEPEAKPAPVQQRAVVREEPRRDRPAEREPQPARERPPRQDSRRGRGRGDESRSQREGREPLAAEEENREQPEREGRRRRGRGERRRPPREREVREERVNTEHEEVVARDTPRRREEPRRQTEERMVKEERAEEPPKQPEPAREEPLKSAAISLWHKIFGTPAEQTAKLAEERAEEKAAAPLEFREDPHDADRRTSVEVDEPVSAEQADELERGEDSASIGDERPRGRSRRRRGRGRGRRPETADVESELDEQFEGQTRTSQRADRKERRGDESDEELGGEEPSGAREPHEETDEGDEEELVGAGVSRRSVLQRAIPSWEEAIGFIVDANMQNRSQRKPPSRSGSREGGGGRGRSRGRRRPQ